MINAIQSVEDFRLFDERKLEGGPEVLYSAERKSVAQPHATSQDLKTSQKIVRTNFFKALVVAAKAFHPKYGRTRIRQVISPWVPGSESSIGRVLRELGIQNPVKQRVGSVVLTLTLPQECPVPVEIQQLFQPGNAKLLLFVLYRATIRQLIAQETSQEIADAIEAYLFPLLANKRLYQTHETIPPELKQQIYGEELPSLAKIRHALETVGKHVEDLMKKLLPDQPPQSLAIDEKVVEKWIKKFLAEKQETNPDLGVQYVSRRGKPLPAVSSEVVAVIDEEGTGIPIYFEHTPVSTPKSILKGKNSGKHQTVEDKSRGPPSLSPPASVSQTPKHPPATDRKTSNRRRSTKQPKKNSSTPRTKKKDAQYIITLLTTVIGLVGMIPLRMDNGYGAKAVIKWLMEHRWQFIVHVKSNLKIVQPVKEYMKNKDLRYYKRKIAAKGYGGRLTIVGYRKRKKIYCYATNEEGNAEELIARYRKRWRIENLFKWCPCLALLPGIDPNVHKGHQFVVYFFMSHLVRDFHASLPTINQILNQPCITVLRDDQLNLTFPTLTTRHVKILERFTASLSVSWKAQLRRLDLQ